jgi:hypothetical protein
MLLAQVSLHFKADAPAQCLDFAGRVTTNDLVGTVLFLIGGLDDPAIHQYVLVSRAIGRGRNVKSFFIESIAIFDLAPRP